MHDDQALNHTCAEAALAFIRQQMSEEKVDEAMRAATERGRLLPPALPTQCR